MQDATVGERGRVEDVYLAESRSLWRALFAYSGDPDVASDALAEAVARALRDDEQIRDLSPWLWRVAFRIAAAELRLRSRTPPHAGGAAYDIPDPVPELMRALRQLSPNQRLALILHDYADRSTREVAVTLGCSQATVHVHLSNGRRRLRRLLGGADE
jgi:RNA polymerase sigma-70 factor, ECF subfamily